MKKQKIRLCWTCSDYIHHEHKYKWTANLCGQFQYYVYKLTGIRIRGEYKWLKK